MYSRYNLLISVCFQTKIEVNTFWGTNEYQYYIKFAQVISDRLRPIEDNIDTHTLSLYGVQCGTGVKPVL